MSASPDPREAALRVRDFLHAHRDAILRDTVRIIQFQTVSGGDAAEQERYEAEIPACFQWLAGRARDMGFDFEDIRGIVGIVSWDHPDPDAPVVAIPCHIDVVTPVGEWTHPPFSGEMADGQIWGRGALDDKGPVVQVLYGLWAMKECGFRPRAHFRILVGTMEETSDWSDMQAYLDERGAPDYGFTPDAEFPIINGEKGMLSVILDAEWDEPGAGPGGLEFIRLNGGERENIVPSRCEIRLRFDKASRSEVLKEIVRTTTAYTVENAESNLTLLPERDIEDDPGRSEAVLTFVGRAAHSSTPSKGHNAILDAIDFIKDIQAFPQGLRHFGAFLHIACADLAGANVGIGTDHDFIGPTTVSLSLLDARPGRARAVANIRPTMGLGCADATERIRAAAGEFAAATGQAIRVEMKTPAKEAVFLDPTDPAVAPFLESLQAGFQAVTGREPVLHAIGGTTYAKAIPNCCAFGPVLTPDEPELFHQADERVSVDAVLRNAAIYGTSLALLASRDLVRNGA